MLLCLRSAYADALSTRGISTAVLVGSFAEIDGVIEMRKCDTDDNIADIFTKPHTGALFARAEDSIMGIPTATVALPL